MSRRGILRTVAALTPAARLCALAMARAACCARDDPFTGLWWEPSTGRRNEIRGDGHACWFYCGAGNTAASTCSCSAAGADSAGAHPPAPVGASSLG